MQTKLNLIFLLCLFSISTSLCADNDTRLADTLDMLKKEFPTIQCNQQKLLSRYNGTYVKKDFWIKLEKTKNYALSLKKESDLLIIDINEYGLGISFNYHEGQGYECTFEKDNVLWACVDNWCKKLQIDHQKQLFMSFGSYDLKDFASLSTQEIPMDGPFIRIGKSGDNSAYFEKIFQHKCYTSDIGEKWCFGKDEITIGSKAHKVDLLLDIVVATPRYGNTLIFDDQSSDNLFVFVPYKNGWKIFQDTWFDRENYVDVNPLIDKPWRVLRK